MTEESKKYCGNCHYHSPWDYPDKIFCEYWFLRNKSEDSIRETLSSCEEWKPKLDVCYCVEDALRKTRKNYRRNEYKKFKVGSIDLITKRK